MIYTDNAINIMRTETHQKKAKAVESLERIAKANNSPVQAKTPSKSRETSSYATSTEPWQCPCGNKDDGNARFCKRCGETK